MLIYKRIGSDKGFTLIEIMVALVITVVVMAGVFAAFQTTTRHSTSQDMLLEAQQNARAGIGMMEKDLVLLGHRVDLPDLANILIVAEANAIEFRFLNPVTGERVKTRYAVNADRSLTRQRCVQDTSWATCPDDNNWAVVDNLESTTALVFNYFQGDGTELTTLPLSIADRRLVRFVKISLTTVTRGKLPTLTPPTEKTVTTHTQVRLRNVEISSAATDTDPPAQAGSLEVREVQVGGRSGICGRLQLKWDKGAEGDLAGYRIYYTLGATTNSVSVPLGQLTDGGTYYTYVLAPTGTNALQNSFSDGSSTSEYSIVISAYDTAGNTGDPSAPVSGNPDPSQYTFGVGSNDTTINPSKPAAVTGFVGQDGATNGQVQLDWSYDTTNNPDVVGFRVFRNTAPFITYPITISGDIEWIAGASDDGQAETVSSTDTTYTDNDALVGCSTYYYAIAPVNCDPTLINDGGGTPYEAADYGVTYGDGDTNTTQTGGEAGGVDSPAGSDTMPAEVTPPPSPTMGARAGWKRVAVTLNQPGGITDLSRTCIYANDSATYPAVRTDTATYPLVATCYDVDNLSTPNARLVPDSGGVYTVAELGSGASDTFWHDSWTLEEPGSPTLDNSATYSYQAVSFDICGNASALVGAQAEATLCDEDPASGEKPPVVTAPSFSCCDADDPSHLVTLNWTEVPSGPPFSTISNPYDLAGYRIFRNPNNTDWTGATMLTAAPVWGGTFSDGTAADGQTYYYRIVTTDCPYEKGTSTGGTPPIEGEIRNHMISDFLNYVTLGPVTTGLIVRDEKCPDSAMPCSAVNHNEVLTGVDIDMADGSGDGGSSPSTSYTHGTVTLFFKNTSLGFLTIQRLGVKWKNSSALLKSLTMRGGKSGQSVSPVESFAPASTTVTLAAPYTREVANYDISDVQINGNTRYIPITFEFVDAVNNPVDMREDQLEITLEVRNDSSGTTGCKSYMTVNEAVGGIVVPLGPNVWGTQQSRPTGSTTPYAVPGSSANAVPNGSYADKLVFAGQTVTVSTTATPNTIDEDTGLTVPVTSMRLYGEVTDITVTTMPAFFTYSGDMTWAGGNNYKDIIPDQPGKRVWYYLVAIDADGNFDRDPEIDEGAYTYDQEFFDPCNVDLAGPDLTTLTTTLVAPGSDTATLTWAEPTTYNNDPDFTPINAADSVDGYKVYRADSFGGGYVAVASGDCYGTLGVVSGLTCVDDSGLDLDGNDYSWRVKAINSCTVENEGDYSSTQVECENSAGVVLAVDTNSITENGSFTITVSSCSDGGNALSDTINNVITSSTSRDADTFSITEDAGDGGVYTQLITTTSTAPATDDLDEVYIDTSDTITVTLAAASSGSPQTITVNADPCLTTPDTPADFCSGGNSCGTSGNDINLAWTASTAADLAGYIIEERVQKNDLSTDTGWYERDNSVSAAATSISLTKDQGSFSSYLYQFRIKAKDSCTSPGPNESADSPQWDE